MYKIAQISWPEYFERIEKFGKNAEDEWNWKSTVDNEVIHD